MFRGLNRGLLIRILWHFFNALFLQNPLNPSSRLKITVLRLFDARIGARATVLPGVTVKSHSIIAAGSVIAKDTEPYMIYAGNPAVAVKERRVKGEG